MASATSSFIRLSCRSAWGVSRMFTPYRSARRYVAGAPRDVGDRDRLATQVIPTPFGDRRSVLSGGRLVILRSGGEKRVERSLGLPEVLQYPSRLVKLIVGQPIN